MQEGSNQSTVNGDRRQGDRRKAQLPYDGPDRRKGERRSGEDRRKGERRSGGLSDVTDMRSGTDRRAT